MIGSILRDRKIGVKVPDIRIPDQCGLRFSTWNFEMLNRSVIFLCTLLALTVFVADPVLAQTSGIRLWTTAYTSSGKCRAFSAATGPEATTRAVTGFAYPIPHASGSEFIERTILHLNAAAAGRGRPDKLRDRLLAAAQTDAYTRLDFGARGGSSPSFVTSVMVRTIAYSVSYLRSQNALSNDDLKTIDRWVSKLMRNMGTRANSIDHKASIGAAQMAWGAASGDRSLYDKGLRRVGTVMAKLRRAPRFDDKVRVNTEVLPIVLMAGHIAWLNGQDLFATKTGQHDLHDAVNYHASWVTQTGTAKVHTELISDTEARSIMKSEGWGTHQAWIPLYLAHFPKGHASASVKQLHRQVKQAQNIAYYGRNMGLHSACYFGL